MIHDILLEDRLQNTPNKQRQLNFYVFPSLHPDSKSSLQTGHIKPISDHDFIQLISPKSLVIQISRQHLC